MIVWRRGGMWALFLPLLVVPVVALLIGVAGIHWGHDIAGMAVGCILSGIALWFLGRRLNGPACEVPWFDPKTGEETIVRNTHHLYYIPLEWWSIPWALLGLWLFGYIALHR